MSSPAPPTEGTSPPDEPVSGPSTPAPTTAPSKPVASRTIKLRTGTSKKPSPLLPATEASTSGAASATAAATPQSGVPEYDVADSEGPDVAPGSAPYRPGYVNSTLAKTGGPTPRNMPVKRYDGEPLSRSDLQHALLCHLFNDTTRCFTNPRPGKEAPAGSRTWRMPTMVYPNGTARHCARRSDETPEEFAEWKAKADAWDAARPVGEGFENNKLTDAERAEKGFPSPGADKLTFKELYIESLCSAGKCTKAMREKLLSDEEYAEDFAKVCLLVNVGRINTTLAFYPEMKTILRSYHPLACVQRNENTRRNMQDAPRMKSLLKSVLLDTERPGIAGSVLAASAAPKTEDTKPTPPDELGEAPGSLAELVAKRRRMCDADDPLESRGVTSVVTLIFVLSMQAQEVTQLHFAPPHDFFSLFFPHAKYPLPAKERARAFLWLVWHYLERGVDLPPGSPEHANPFSDEQSTNAAKEALQAWNAMSEEERKKITDAKECWRGLPNPEFATWEKPEATEDKEPPSKKRKSSEEASTSTVKVDEQGDSHMQEAATSSAAAAAVADEPIPPPEYTHRLLAPALHPFSIPSSAAENVDTQDEIDWAAGMKGERAAFLLRFQEEEQAKAAAGAAEQAEAAGSSSTTRESPDPTGAKAKAKVKKRNTIPLGGSSAYPLANIIAATKEPLKEAAAAAAAAAAARATSVQAEAPPPAPTGLVPSDVPNLWTLDLSVPPPPNGIARNRNMSSAAHFAAQAAALSLPKVAWRRILERARRGVGDASYESDAEELAEEEGRDERPRGELSRILRCLRDVRTARGELEMPPLTEAQIELQMRNYVEAQALQAAAEEAGHA